MELVALNAADNGFTAGELSIKGYFAAVSAYQAVYFCDGRPYSATIGDSGYHRIDMTATNLVGAASGLFETGETVLQGISEAAGIFLETVGSGATAKHLIYRTTTVEFDAVNEITGAISGTTLTPTAVKPPPQWLSWILRRDPGTIDYAHSGTADFADVTTLIDAELTPVYGDDEINNWYCYIISGTGYGSYAKITDFVSASGLIIVAGWLNREDDSPGTDPAAGSNYGLRTTKVDFSGGEFPDGGSNIMCLFDGRLWLNSMYNPHQWFATRQGNPQDLDTSQDDVQAAISSQVSEAGLVGDAIVAFIPFKDNYLLFGCANSFAILRGGSTGGGALSNLSSETGIFSPESWCWDNEGNLYVIGLTGFFKFPNAMATAGTAIDNISNRLLPNLFRTLKLNRQTDRVVLGYDRDTNEVHVSITTQDGGWAVNWAYDAGSDSLFPDTFSSGHKPSAYLYMNSYQDGVAGLLIGGYDGYIRKFDNDTKQDDPDDEAVIDSYVLFGPVTLNNVIRGNIKVQEIQIILSEDSDGIEWYLYQGETNEQIVKGIKEGTLTPVYSGTSTTGGEQISIREKISGKSIAIMLRSKTLGCSWGIESGIKIKYTMPGQVKE